MSDLLNKPARDLARTLIRTLGTGATLIKKTSSNYSPSTGDVVTDEDQHAITVSPPMEFQEHEYVSEQMKQAEFHCFMAAKGSEIIPKTGYELVFSGVRYRVVGINLIHGGSQPAAYELGLVK